MRDGCRPETLLYTNSLFIFIMITKTITTLILLTTTTISQINYKYYYNNKILWNFSVCRGYKPSYTRINNILYNKDMLILNIYVSNSREKKNKERYCGFIVIVSFLTFPDATHSLSRLEFRPFLLWRRRQSGSHAFRPTTFRTNAVFTPIIIMTLFYLYFKRIIIII